MIIKKKIEFHVNHYAQDEKIYQPIIDKLILEGWEIDSNRTKTEFIGTHEFRHVWLQRVFNIEK